MRPATLVELVEASAVVLILLLMSQALLGRLGDPEQTGQGAAWLRTMWLPCYGVIILLMALRSPRLTAVWPAAVILLPLVGWAFLSRYWSLEPDATFRRALALAFATLFGLYIAARYDWRSWIEIIGLVSLILALGSLFAVLIFPAFGKMDDVYVGAWRGLWFEKNAMGGYMARGALACLCAAILAPPRRLIWFGGAALCAFMVVTTGSTTALLATLVAFAGVCGIALLRRGPAWAVVGLWLMVVTAAAFTAMMIFAPDIFFDAVGKDATLTGRAGLWEALQRQIDLRPLTGYGYGAFWQGRWGPADVVRAQVQWAPHNADNAWMELLIQIGWVGLVLAAASLAIYALAAVCRLWGGPEAYWCILFLIMIGLFSISESMLARPNDTTWVMFVATLGKLLQRRRTWPDTAC